MITIVILIKIKFQEEARRRRERVHFDDRTRGGSGASGIMMHTYMNAYIRT
jgi:hypothetical protein